MSAGEEQLSADSFGKNSLLASRPMQVTAADKNYELLTPFSPSLISLVVSVDVKHHVYLQL